MPGIGLLVHYNIYFLFSFLFISAAIPQDYPDVKVHSLLKAGIDETIRQNYAKADSIFSYIDKNYPHLPLGKIYQAANMLAKNFDYGEEFNSEYITGYLEAARKQSTEILEHDDKNIWSRYFMALSKGYYSYFEALNGSLILSFTDGLSSIIFFEQCLEQSPDFYEAYTALGTYKYWKSAKLEFLNWLPFVEDEREEGIKYLEKAVRSSSYNKYLAANSLIWIYIDQHKYKDAVNISLELLKKYPDTRFFKWGLARAYENLDSRKSIDVYYNILNSYRDAAQNGYNEILLKHKIAQQFAKVGERDKAKKLCIEILDRSKNISIYVKEKLGERIRRVEKLLEAVE